jgi:hypothetical protein
VAISHHGLTKYRVGNGMEETCGETLMAGEERYIKINELFFELIGFNPL